MKNFEQITGLNEDQQIANDVAHIGEKNPELAKTLERLLQKMFANGNDKSFKITGQMRSGANGNDLFLTSRLPKED